MPDKIYIGDSGRTGWSPVVGSSRIGLHFAGIFYAIIFLQGDVHDHNRAISGRPTGRPYENGDVSQNCIHKQCAE